MVSNTSLKKRIVFRHFFLLKKSACLEVKSALNFSQNYEIFFFNFLYIFMQFENYIFFIQNN